MSFTNFFFGSGFCFCFVFGFSSPPRPSSGFLMPETAAEKAVFAANLPMLPTTGAAAFIPTFTTSMPTSAVSFAPRCTEGFFTTCSPARLICQATSACFGFSRSISSRALSTYLTVQLTMPSCSFSSS